MSTKTKNKEKIRVRVHTTISMEKENILNAYAKLKDKDGNKIYGNKSKVIEKALDLLEKFHHPDKEEEHSLWNRTKDELKMLLVGKPTFIAYITGDYKNVYRNNIALDLVEWYAQKAIDELSVEDILNAIKKIWITANYFYKISIEKGSKGNYIMLLYHEFQNERFGEFWANYFSYFLSEHKKCKVEYFIRTSFVRLVITPLENIDLSQDISEYRVTDDKYRLSEIVEVW